MNNYFKTRTATVRFVEDQLEHLKRGSVLTMTIVQDTSGDFSVLTVTDVLSGDTEKARTQFS